MTGHATYPISPANWLWACVLLMCSCAVGKYVPEGEMLYTGATVELEAPDTVGTGLLSRSLSRTVDERPTVRLFGPGFKTYMHYRYQVEEPKGLLRKFMKFITKPVSREPVYYSEDIPERTMDILGNRATNLGYFYNKASYTIDTTTRKQGIEVQYNVVVGADYRLGTLQYAITDSAIAEVIREGDKKSLLTEGERYSLGELKNERIRIQKRMREAGYYYFVDSDLEFLADTVASDRHVQLLLKLKDDTPAAHLTRYRIDSILIYSDYSPEQDTMSPHMDTANYQGLTIICQDCPLRPEVLHEAFAIHKGDLYSPQAHDKTVGRLSGYNTFRYVGLNYNRVPGEDSLLHLTAHLSPLLRRRIEGEVGAAYNSGRYFGPEAGLTYTNRNLLEGAELLRLDGDLSYAFFVGHESETRVPRSGTYNVNASLNVPRLWLPNRERMARALGRSATRIEVGGSLENLQLRLRQFSTIIADEGYDELADLLAQDSSVAPNVSLMQLRAQYGYFWQRKQSIRNTFNPLSIRYQLPVARSDQLLQLSRRIGLTSGSENLGRLDRMFLFSPNYQFLHDTRLKRYMTHNFYISCYLSVNFNSISPVGENASILEREQSRYIQVEPDFRYYLILDDRRQIALRLHTGIAFPLGTRVIVPYFDLYTVGGPNSVRGFIPRGIGPGSTVPKDNNLLTEGGYGNVLVEASIEFRQKLNSTFEIGVFADAGNVWTYKTAGAPLPTDFALSDMPGELGISAGAGLRFTLQSLVLRLDLAKPLQLPYTVPEGETRDDRLKLVVGFGYPF